MDFSLNFCNSNLGDTLWFFKHDLLRNNLYKPARSRSQVRWHVEGQRGAVERPELLGAEEGVGAVDGDGGPPAPGAGRAEVWWRGCVGGWVVSGGRVGGGGMRGGMRGWVNRSGYWWVGVGGRVDAGAGAAVGGCRWVVDGWLGGWVENAWWMWKRSPEICGR